MPDDDAPRPAMRQLLWIAAGVAVLTLLVVALSWLFSPRPAPGDSAAGPGASALREEQVEKNTFAPETPGAPRPAGTQVPQPPERISEEPKSPEIQTPSAEDLPAPAPRPPAANPKSEPKVTVPPAQPSARPGPQASSRGFAVQVGAFSGEAKAREVAGRLKGLGYTPSVLSKDGKYKVLARGFADRAAAETALAALAKAGIRDPFIVHEE